ncbi:hypothetical protein D7X33_20235 [Butyricicoccus sp. 1XD8-22]|nr:hypothetical protein D7X33_20235 [Butyricicoccus sp. 1XD8-22]
MSYIDDFKNYRENQKISPNTIAMEVRYLTKFHTFLNILHKRKVPVWEITFKDVAHFFDEESKHLSDRTLYRKITIISLYYDYLWNHNHITIDFMTKFRQKYRNLLDWDIPEIKVDYQVMLDRKEEIIQSTEIHLMPKLIYLLLLRGVTLADMIKIEIDDIVLHSNTAHIIYETSKDKLERNLIYDTPVEVELIREGIALAGSRGVPFLLSTKSKTDKQYTMFNPVNLHDMVKPIESILEFPVSSTNKVLYAYVHFLATIQKKSVEEMSRLLGMTKPHTAKILKTTLERINKI